MRKIIEYEVVSLELYDGLFSSEHKDENDFTKLIINLNRQTDETI